MRWTKKESLVKLADSLWEWRDYLKFRTDCTKNRATKSIYKRRIKELTQQINGIYKMLGKQNGYE